MSDSKTKPPEPAEIAALRTLYEALEPLTFVSRQRVLKAAGALLDLDLKLD